MLIIFRRLCPSHAADKTFMGPPPAVIPISNISSVCAPAPLVKAIEFTGVLNRAAFTGDSSTAIMVQAKVAVGVAVGEAVKVFVGLALKVQVGVIEGVADAVEARRHNASPYHIHEFPRRCLVSVSGLPVDFASFVPKLSQRLRSASSCSGVILDMVSMPLHHAPTTAPIKQAMLNR